jgi:DNA-binding NarL/FixJ family response regulator
MRNNNNRKPINILIVEDSFFFSKWLSNELQNIDGISISGITDNVNDALMLINEKEIDIAILDFQLKEGLGIEVLKYIKSNHKDIKAIMFSNYAEFKNDCLKLGADYFYDKSNEFEDLINVISNWK